MTTLMIVTRWILAGLVTGALVVSCGYLLAGYSPTVDGFTLLGAVLGGLIGGGMGVEAAHERLLAMRIHPSVR